MTLNDSRIIHVMFHNETVFSRAHARDLGVHVVWVAQIAFRDLRRRTGKRNRRRCAGLGSNAAAAVAPIRVQVCARQPEIGGDEEEKLLWISAS